MAKKKAKKKNDKTDLKKEIEKQIPKNSTPMPPQAKMGMIAKDKAMKSAGKGSKS